MAAVTRRQYKGAAASTTITATLTNVATTTTLTATTGWPSTAAVPFYVVIDPGTSSEEKCEATISGSTLTLTRGADDTTAVAHASGATIYPVFSADEADEANNMASTMTTKGDLLVTTGSAFDRLAVGTDRKKLTADSAETNGIKWQFEGELTLNAQTGTTYTFVLTDSAKFVTLSNAAAIALSIPTNASVAFPTGTQINIVQLGAGQVTVGGAGVTIRSQGTKLKLNGQYSAATCIKIGTDEWVLVGNTAA